MQEILDHADELAAKFENYEPAEGDRKDATALRALRAAVLTQADAERAVAAAVATARQAGHSWSAIGAMVGTTGEAARQRYAAGGGNDSTSGRKTGRGGPTVDAPKVRKSGARSGLVPGTLASGKAAASIKAAAKKASRTKA